MAIFERKPERPKMTKCGESVLAENWPKFRPKFPAVSTFCRTLLAPRWWLSHLPLLLGPSHMDWGCVVLQSLCIGFTKQPHQNLRVCLVELWSFGAWVRNELQSSASPALDLSLDHSELSETFSKYHLSILFQSFGIQIHHATHHIDRLMVTHSLHLVTC